jgi:hypothetical protein
MFFAYRGKSCRSISLTGFVAGETVNDDGALGALLPTCAKLATEHIDSTAIATIILFIENSPASGHS